MADVICAECGTKNSGGGEFCSSCGAFLAWDGVADEPPPPPPPPPVGVLRPGPPAPPAPRRAAPTASPSTDRPPPPPTEPAGGFSYTIKAPPGRAVSLPPADPGGGWPPAPGGPAAGAVAVAAPPGTCPDCGTVNSEELRFCRKCGFQLFTPDPRTPKPVAARPVRRPWWQRWIPRSWLPDSDLVSGQARRAFRRSLPPGLRIRRYLGIAAVVALIGGLLFVVGNNPVRWVKDRIGDLRGSLSEVALTVASEPPDAQVPGYPVEYVVDRQETAWATTWRPPGTAGSCVPPGVAAPAGSMGTLLLVLSAPTTVRALEIAAGLPESDQRRPHQYRPKTLELTFSDGTCRQVAVADDPALQQIPLDPIVTDQIRVSIVDVWPPLPDNPMDLVAITEIRVLARPQ